MFMKDETAIKMYESARDRLQELLRQEAEIKEQISGWVPVVEQLASLCGEKMDPELVKRANPASNQEIAGQDMGLTESIRWVFRQGHLVPLTPVQVRNELAAMGYDLEKYKHVMPPIHNTLNRLKEAGEIKEVDGLGGLGKAFVSAK
jgi:hypothetical protein